MLRILLCVGTSEQKDLEYINTDMFIQIRHYFSSTYEHNKLKASKIEPKYTQIFPNAFFYTKMHTQNFFITILMKLNKINI